MHLLVEKVEKSRNNELRDLFQSGLGCHHAGMLRADRGLTERAFEDGAIKVSIEPIREARNLCVMHASRRASGHASRPANAAWRLRLGTKLDAVFQRSNTRTHAHIAHIADQAEQPW